MRGVGKRHLAVKRHLVKPRISAKRSIVEPRIKPKVKSGKVDIRKRHASEINFGTHAKCHSKPLNRLDPF